MKKRLFTGLIFIIDVLVVGFSFLMIAWHRAGTRIVIRNYSRPLFGFLIIWLTVSFLSQKYNLLNKKGWLDISISTIKVNIVSLGIVSLFVYFFHLFFYSRSIVFGTIALATIFEIIVFIAIYYSLRFRQDNLSFSSSVLVTKSTELEKQQAGSFFTSNNYNYIDKPYTPLFDYFLAPEDAAYKTLHRYLDNSEKLFDFISDNLDLMRFNKHKSLIINSSNFFNIQHIEKNSQQLFVNLHKINDFRRINRYFIRVNENIEKGGVFICCGETIGQRYQRFLYKSGKIFGTLFYAFDFFFRRVSPKIPLLQGLYFFLTKGTDRSISETEILGRLYFCGFEVIEYTEINSIMFFIMKKTKEPSADENPSYGPLIKLKRVGKGGNLFNCFKVRTMHPYSEYLQEYIFNRCRVSESGKFADDFRITSWGKIMRLYWLDELPQLFNLIKGDLVLIGARALSRHYFDQYPPDLKEMRLKYKPGLIPVYTADRVTTLVGLIQSERKYLQKKQKNPLLTDIIYFSKAVFNIITRQAKSLDTYKEETEDIS